MTDPIETLRQHNAWRRGDDTLPMLDQRTIGEAIDATFYEVERLRAEVAALRTGDTCARQCEGSAYHIEARKEKIRADALELKISDFRFSVNQCYLMLLSEINTKRALFKAENMLRDAMAASK